MSKFLHTNKTRYTRLLAERRAAGLRLGLGLDVEFDRLPPSLVAKWKHDPAAHFMALSEFMTEAGLAVQDMVAAIKPNLAFLEGQPEHDCEAAFKDASRRIRLNGSNSIPFVVDGKRCDIGNSAKGYARHMINELGGEAVTIVPYMGMKDSMDVFIDNYPDTTHFILCRTSNKGAKDLQDMLVVIKEPADIDLLLTSGMEDLTAQITLHEPLSHPHETLLGDCDAYAIPQYLWVAILAANRWNIHGNLGLVVGATAPDQLRNVCQAIHGTNIELLIPGSKTQGGKIETIVPILRRYNCLDQATIFVSRAALYPEQGHDGEDWAEQISERFNAIHRQVNELAKV